MKIKKFVSSKEQAFGFLAFTTLQTLKREEE